jgi:TonB-linked SusC/RagA family outer membrane protein
MSGIAVVVKNPVIWRSVLISILSGLLCISSFGQVRTITGTVSASDTKETLPGATVVIKGTTTGVVTDVNGKYSIQVPAGKDTLVFSYVGYSPAEIRIQEQPVIDVVLQLTKVSLGEIVVIGYGTVKKSDLTGAVSSIKANEITKITALNPVESLEGKVSGVQITNIDGTPGNSPVVRIRGIGTINNSSPVYVVDGLILDDIAFLNAADIASIEVLKDASATAIYGNRGANGVIIITTKTGEVGEGHTKVSFNAETGIQKVAHKIPLLNGKEFAIISNEIIPGTYNNVDAVNNTDWQNEIFRLAPIYKFDFSASGASKIAQYYFGLGYFGQEGIIDQSYFQRLTIQLNNTYNLGKYIKLGNKITLTPTSQRIAPNVTFEAYRADPTIAPFSPGGAYSPVPGVGNPLADLAYSNNYVKGIRGVGSFFGEVKFLKMFVLKSNLGLDASYYKGESFTPAYDVSVTQFNLYSNLSKAWSDNLTWLWENTLNFNQDFGKHHIDAVAGFTMQNSTNEMMSLTGENIIRDGSNFWYIQPTYIVDPGNNINTLGQLVNNVDPGLYYSMVSLLFRANYTFNNRYILTVTYRRDGSSKFNTANRWGDFPSVALGWNIAHEKFLQKAKFLSRLKLRGSWGIIGNDKIDYTSRFSLVESDLVTIFGISPGAYPGASYAQIGNDKLKWENSTQTDIGLEAGFFNDRLNSEFDFYNKITNDILVGLTIPAYFGNGLNTKEVFNAAKVLNRGFEFNISWRDQIGKVKYNVGVNGSTIYNRVQTIGGVSGSDTVLLGGYLSNGIPVTASKVGLPIGSFYGYKTDGLFQTQAELDAYPHLSDATVGSLRFVDINGDGVLDGRDRTNIGSPIPSFIFGLTLGTEFYGFDVTLDLQGQTGNKIFNAKEVVRPDKYNFETHVMGAWTSPGSSTTEPVASFGGYNYNPSDHFIQNGTYLRIRDVILGYTIPTKLSEKIYMKKLRVYLKADNLYVWTKFTGYSPDIGSSDVLSNGIDYGEYPTTTVYSAGLNINF